jgi:peptidoglycan hydrolase-like protein with peptidoglycan-binding domain
MLRLRAGRFFVNARLRNASNGGPSLRQGEKGEAVAIVQQALVDLGFAMPLTTQNGRALTDGIFGDETARIVSQFQRKFRLVTDGIVGHHTMAKLDELILAQSESARAEDRRLASNEFGGGSAMPSS